MNKSIKELAQIFYGKDYKSNPVGDKYPIYGTGGIMGYTSKALNFGPAVLSGRKGSINNPIYVEGGFWNVDTIYCLKPFSGTDPKWLYYNLLNTDLSTLNEATGVPSVSTQALNKLKFKYFEGSEQRKIATILSNADSVIEKTEAAIAKYKTLKKGMMQDLFTRGIDLETGKLRQAYKDAPELYKETELGWIPKEWEVKNLDEITFKIGDGLHSTPNYVDETNYHFINGNNLVDGKIQINSSTKCVSRNEFEKYNLKLNNYTLLYSINGTIGNIAYYRNERVVLGKSAAFISLENPFLTTFLFYQLSTNRIRKFFDIELTGSTIKNLSLRSIRNAPIFLPVEINEVKEINNHMSKIDELIKKEKANLSKHQSLKKGLMQDLLTGKVEVEV